MDILPRRKLPLAYIQKIKNSQGQVIGLLCLSFKFDDELTKLSTAINPLGDVSEENLVLLNPQNEVLFSERHANLPKILPDLPLNRLTIINLKTVEYFAYATMASGYQGFSGLPWKSVMLVPLKSAFSKKETGNPLALSTESSLFPQDLNELNLEVNTALLIVVLNGKIISLKNKVKAFLPVLDSFQEIGAEIRHIFSESISHIHRITHQTLAAEVSFLAKLAMDIMDRNLYERANDCRWWALNEHFSQVLGQQGGVRKEELIALTDTLNYINGLYTVYRHVFVFDKQGHIVAISNDVEGQFQKKNVFNDAAAQQVLKVNDAQQYRVSLFEPSFLYGNQPTYIYYAAINGSSGQGNVGGVGVVFDSRPEFEAILKDFLPRNAKGEVLDGSFSAFVDGEGYIISISENPFAFEVGQKIPVDIAKYQETENGQLTVTLNCDDYLVGYQFSKGYREYKVSDGYQNQVIALVFVKS